MSEQTLKEVLQISVAVLGKLRQKMHTRSSSELSQIIQKDVYNTWDKRALLENELKDALFLIECHDVQRASMEELKSVNECLTGNEKIERLVNYGNGQHPLRIIRNLVVTTYLGSIWAVYDKLSNVVGRMLGGDDILKNQMLKENPKLTGNFISPNNTSDKKKIITMMSVNSIVNQCFGEYVALSYLLRNCFIHEGGTIGKVQIFTGETVDTAFCIDEEVAKELNRGIEESYAIRNPTIARCGDLLEQLEACHKQIDKCFSGLLQFAVGSLKLQIDAFMALDNYAG